MKPGLTKATLSEPRRQLVGLMQNINFDRIEKFRVLGSDPVLDPLPHLVREVKFGGDNGPRAEREADNFLLKAQVVELFQHFDQLGDGTIAVLDIKHGLPFRLLIAEATA